MSGSCSYITSGAEARDYLIGKGAIDRYGNILSLGDFTKYNNEVSDKANKDLIMQGKLFTINIKSRAEYNKDYSQLFDRKNGKTYPENEWAENYVDKLSTVHGMMEGLSNKFNMPYSIVSDSEMKRITKKNNVKGIFKDGKVYINLMRATRDTPYHEFLHPYLLIAKEHYKDVYNNIVSEAMQDIDSFNAFRASNFDVSPEDMIDEYIIDIVSKNASNRLPKTPDGLWSAIKAFLDKIKDIVGFRSINEFTTLGKIADMLLDAEIKVDLAHKVKFNLNKIYYSEELNDDGVMKNLEEGAKGWEIEKDEQGNEKDYYINKLLNKTRKRVTEGFISLFSNKVKYEEDFPTHKANKAWKDGKIDKTQKIVVEPKIGEESYEEYKERISKSINHGRLKGNILESMTQKVLINGMDIKPEEKEERLKTVNEDIERNVLRLQELTGEEFYADFYSWVNAENMKIILERHNINTLVEGLTPNLRDKLFFQVKVGLEELGLMGTIDILSKKATGHYSIYDITTGNNFDTYSYDILMKYGDQTTPIVENNRNQKKLQIMLYAFMIKANNPQALFDDLNVMWMPYKNSALRYDMNMQVEVDSYLKMIESFLKDKNALRERGLDEDVYEKLLKKSPRLFSTADYMGADGIIISENQLSHKGHNQMLATDETALELLQAEMEAFGSKNMTPEKKKRIKELTESVFQQKKLPNISNDIRNETDEMNWFEKNLGNWSDAIHPIVKMVRVMYLDAKDIFDRAIYRKKQIFRSYADAVVKESRAKGISDYSKIWSKFITYINYEGYQKGVFLTKDNAPDKYNALSDTEKKLIDYVNNTIAEYFTGPDAMMKKVAYKNKLGENVTYQKLMEMDGFEFVYGFMPKIRKTSDEVIKDYGGISSIFNKEYWNYKWKQATHFYVNDTHEERDENKKDSMPLRYLDNINNLQSENYSHEIPYIFEKFINMAETKKQMQSVYLYGRAARFLLDDEDMTNVKNEKLFARTAEFLDNRLTHDILGKSKKTKYSSVRVAGKTIDFDNVLYFLMNWTRLTSMALKPVNAGGNFLHMKLVTQRDAIKNNIADWSFYNEFGSLDFKESDTAFAEGEYLKYVKDSMIGNVDKNKAWQIVKYLNLLPDNFDISNEHKRYATLMQKTLSSNTLYLSHSLLEEQNAINIAVAQLRSMKHPTIKDKDGNPASIYSLYDVEQDEKTGAYMVVWKGGSRGYEIRGSLDKGTRKEITELTGLEKSRIKKVYEKINGGYSRDESMAMEVYAFGKAAGQFKKYFPRLILNLFGRAHEVTELGYYVDYQTIDKDGKPVTEKIWKQRTTETGWKVIAGSAFHLLKASYSQKSRNELAKMNNEQKKILIDASITMVSFALFYSTYLAMFGDEDDDDSTKKFWEMYLVDNLSQQYNPMDMARTLKTSALPVSINKTFQTAESLSKFLFASAEHIISGDPEAGLTQKGDIKGWNNLKKSIPLLSSYYDLMNKFEHDKSIGFFDMERERLR